MGLSSKQSLPLVMKLSWMQFFPKDNTDGIDALVDALSDCAQNEAHGRRIVDHIQQHDDRSPMPARIRAASLETLTSGDSSAAGCSACGGTGFIYLDQAIPTAVGTVRRCNCMRQGGKNV